MTSACDACPHVRAFVASTGGLHFSAGEVWDDIQDHLICSLCGQVLVRNLDERRPAPAVQPASPPALRGEAI